MPDAVTPLSEDALNRYRLAHTDRDLKPLLTRLHRLAHIRPTASTSTSVSGDVDGGNVSNGTVNVNGSHGNGAGDSNGNGGVEEDSGEREKQILEMEIMKWGIGVKRSWAAAMGIQQEEKRLRERAKATVERTEMLEAMLIEEKKLLERRQRERDGMRKCDEVADRIRGRKRSRQELDEQIETLQQEVAEHRTSYEAYRSAVQSRIDTFAQITRLVDECRSFKLPIDPNATTNPSSDKMEIDEPLVPSGSGQTTSPTTTNASNTKLNAAAPTFQPKPSLPANPTSTSRAATPSSPSGLSSLPPPPVARPPTSRAPSGSSRGARSLPSKPSGLRSSIVPSGAGGGMEEGEVGEDGEVDDRRKSRARK